MDDPYIPTFFKKLPHRWSKEKREKLIDDIYQGMLNNPECVEILGTQWCGLSDICKDCFLHTITSKYEIYCGSVIPYEEADECSDLTDPELMRLFFKWMHEYQLNKTIECSMEESNVKDNSND